MARHEPQSYGSQGEWVEGEVGQEVNRLKGSPNSQHGDFYEPRRESEESGDHQGGDVSPAQLAENAEPVGPATEVSQPQARVSTQPQGAKRGSFFRDRDYK